jgi:hypothetical protein
MKISYAQICTLLAASGLRERDFAEFAHALMQSGPRAFVDDVLHLRSNLHSLHMARSFDVISQLDIGARSEVDHKIERLLLLEAGLPKLTAIELLTEELRHRLPGVPIPPDSRKGFHSWIRKLTSVVSEKELLHIATKLRNRYVHDRPPDWRLK